MGPLRAQQAKATHACRERAGAGVRPNTPRLAQKERGAPRGLTAGRSIGRRLGRRHCAEELLGARIGAEHEQLEQQPEVRQLREPASRRCGPASPQRSLKSGLSMGTSWQGTDYERAS